MTSALYDDINTMTAQPTYDLRADNIMLDIRQHLRISSLGFLDMVIFVAMQEKLMATLDTLLARQSKRLYAPVACVYNFWITTELHTADMIADAPRHVVAHAMYRVVDLNPVFYHSVRKAMRDVTSNR